VSEHGPTEQRGGPGDVTVVVVADDNQRYRTGTVRVIVMSASDDAEHASAAREAGASFVDKTVPRSQICGLLLDGRPASAA
jgi:hypothetical protein